MRVQQNRPALCMRWRTPSATMSWWIPEVIHLAHAKDVNCSRTSSLTLCNKPQLLRPDCSESRFRYLASTSLCESIAVPHLLVRRRRPWAAAGRFRTISVPLHHGLTCSEDTAFGAPQRLLTWRARWDILLLTSCTVACPGRHICPIHDPQ